MNETAKKAAYSAVYSAGKFGEISTRERLMLEVACEAYAAVVTAELRAELESAQSSACGDARRCMDFKPTSPASLVLELKQEIAQLESRLLKQAPAADTYTGPKAIAAMAYIRRIQAALTSPAQLAESESAKQPAKSEPAQAPTAEPGLRVEYKFDDNGYMAVSASKREPQPGDVLSGEEAKAYMLARPGARVSFDGRVYSARSGEIGSLRDDGSRGWKASGLFAGDGYPIGRCTVLTPNHAPSAPVTPRPGAPLEVAELPAFWDSSRRALGKDASTCAAELRVALEAKPSAEARLDAHEKALRFLANHAGDNIGRSIDGVLKALDSANGGGSNDIG